jgi:hypothetical protein
MPPPAADYGPSAIAAWRSLATSGLGHFGSSGESVSDPAGDRRAMVCQNRVAKGGSVDLKNLAGRAKKLIDSRGGTESLKEDAKELKDIATKDESLADKAKDAVEAIKDPGAPGEEPAKPAGS